MEASGIRLGSAAVTTRGLGTSEMNTLGGWIADVLASPSDSGVIQRVRREVAEMTGAFPIYSA